MDLSNATAAGHQQHGSNVRCFRCGRIGHLARECTAPVHYNGGRRGDAGHRRDQQKTRTSSRRGAPTGNAVARADIGHATLRTAAPSETRSRCKKQDDRPNLVILKVYSKRPSDSLRASVDSGTPNDFVRLRSLSRLDFEEVNVPRILLEVRLATDAIVKTEKRVVNVRFSYKQRVFVEHFIDLDLDDNFDVVMGMPWLARHDPVIDWKKRTLVRFGRDSGTASDGPVTAAHAPASARGAPVDTALNAAVPDCPRSARGRAQMRPTSAMLPTSEKKLCWFWEPTPTFKRPGCTTKRHAIKPGLISRARRQGLPAKGHITVQPGCTKEHAVKPGLIPRARGQGPPANNRPRPGLDQKNNCAEPGSAQQEDGTSEERCASLGPGPRRYKNCLPGRQAVTPGVETLNVLTRTDTGFQYQEMALANPPTSASELTSLPVMSWKRFTSDLHDGRIEQVCVLSDSERTESESEELRQLFMGSTTESEDTLSAKTKRERFEEQDWDSLKSSPYYELLREYKDVLPEEIPAELPQDKGIQHEIDLVPGTKYCVTRQWPLPREQVKAIDDFFESRRKAGQVRESKSPHSAPTFCVKKPQGGWRIVHAYNKLNDATVPAQTPIPRKDVIIDSMAGSTVYSALDLRDGFYQILMRGSDISLTAVSTPSGMLWEWLVMPQGLTNAPATFNRCVTHLLRSVRDFAPSYFDDVFIHSRAVDGKTDIEMLRVHLRKLLELMRKHKLYANLKKCIFGASEIPVLGCLVGKNGVRPDPEKVRVINEWPTPSNVKERRQFLGLATCLCKYVEDYAGKIRPLSQLLKKEAVWNWTTDCQKAFDAVKQGLTEAPILAVADQDRPFHVVCDASDFAIGSALMQHDPEGRDRVVYYQSRQLKPAERNYPVHDKELLAMKYALAKFRVYLLGSRPFVVYTDHASLRTAVKSPHISQRMARWLSFFAEYNFRVKYKPGRLNVVADALSRRPDYAEAVDVNAIDVTRSIKPTSSLLDDVKAAYAHDADAKLLLAYGTAPSDKSRQKLPGYLRARAHRFRVHDGLLLYNAVDDNADRVVVPNDHDLRLRIMYEYHDAPTAGHLGREKTYVLLTRDFYRHHQYKWCASTSVLARCANA
ncbi:reverse transcriptase [Phytophthora cinnamomi]|uniref:reverse transcriptase n=1 Tax=Phytophthora cinnamomi TaxID=4785 RepID=UPI0035594ACD|nr:reverse transcriptase [Phytophthora cinnamomi]